MKYTSYHMDYFIIIKDNEGCQTESITTFTLFQYMVATYWKCRPVEAVLYI